MQRCMPALALAYRDLRSFSFLKTALNCCSGRRLPDPYGRTPLRKHLVFHTCARELPFYSIAWVQPVVHPMILGGDWSSSWVGAIDVYGSMPNTLFHNYIKIMLADTIEYQPHIFKVTA